jgi:hypothetical protein
MKKNYELVQVNVISLENEDVITASTANRSTNLFDGNFDLGDYSTQNFGS